MLGYLDVVCTGLGGGIYEPGRAIGCSIVGSTGMHMRFVPMLADAAAQPGAAPATPWRSRYRAACAQMQSNMAATLNIDWVRRPGARGRRAAGPSVRPQDLLADAGCAGARTPSRAAAIYHPYIHEAGERGPFVDANARAQFIGPLDAHAASSISCAPSMRAWPSRHAIAMRAMGHVPGGGPRRRRRRALASVQDDPCLGARSRRFATAARQEAGAAGAAMMAAVAIGVFPDLGAAPRRPGSTPLLGDLFPPDPSAGRHSTTTLFPTYVADPQGDAAGLGRTRRHSRRSSTCMTDDRDHR